MFKIWIKVWIKVEQERDRSSILFQSHTHLLKQNKKPNKKFAAKKKVFYLEKINKVWEWFV